MGLFAPLVALLGHEVGSAVDRAKSTAIIYSVMAVFVLIAVVFFLIAGFLALSDLYSPITAALIMGGAFVVLTLVLYVGAVIGRGQQKKKQAERRRSSDTGALLTTAALTAVPALMRSPLIVRLGIPAAAIAAFAMMRDQSDKD